MKYFNPSYWFKLWVLTAPLFNDKTQGINAKSIDNKKIKDWANNNTTSLESINELNSFTNISNYQVYNLNETNQNINPIYQTDLETSKHKHRHKKSKRIKKQVTPNPRPSKEIFKLNEKLIINENNRIEYQTSFQTIINELVDRGVLTRIRDLNVLVNANFIFEDNTIFALNPESNYGYFRLPVAIRWQQNTQSIENNLELVLRTDNLYLQGFIVNNNYYHFDFRNINMNMQPQAVRDGSIPLLERIEGIQNNIVLNGISPDYRDMIRENDENIYWSNIFGSFFQLINRMDYNFNEQGILIEGALGNLARSLGDVILVTAESLRFWSLHTHIIQQLVNNNQYITLGRNNRNPIYNTLVNWSEESRTQSLIIDLLSTPNDRRPNPNSNQESRNILTEFGYLRRRDDENFVNFLSRILILPINQLTNILAHSNIRIILSYFIKPNLNNCNRRQARQITNNNYWHEKFCDLKPQIDKIQGKITTIKILDENNKGKLTSGEVYVGTTNGFYLIHSNGDVQKFNNIDEEVTSIKVFDKDKFYIITKRNEIYFLRTDRLSNDGLLFGEILNNAESCDLNKEIKLYYNDYKSNVQINFKSDSDDYNTQFKLLNLNKINPLNYKKIDFLGDVDNNCWGTMTSFWRGNKIWVYTNNCASGTGDVQKWELNGENKSIKKFLKDRNNEFHDIIENTKNQVSPNKEQILQKFKDTTISNYEIVNQRFGLTWYWENDNYYLKVFTLQYCPRWKWCDIKLGNGIRLYNDDLDTSSKQKREIKNEIEWNNDFSKSINNEQNLLVINNTNLVKSNITSL